MRLSQHPMGVVAPYSCLREDIWLVLLEPWVRFLNYSTLAIICGKFWILFRQGMHIISEFLETTQYSMQAAILEHRMNNRYTDIQCSRLIGCMCLLCFGISFFTAIIVVLPFRWVHFEHLSFW